MRKRRRLIFNQNTGLPDGDDWNSLSRNSEFWRDLWTGWNDTPDPSDHAECVTIDGEQCGRVGLTSGGHCTMFWIDWESYLKRGYSPTLSAPQGTVVTSHRGKYEPVAPIIVSMAPTYEGIREGTHRIKYNSHDRFDLRRSNLGTQRGGKGSGPLDQAVRDVNLPKGMKVKVDPDLISKPRQVFDLGDPEYSFLADPENFTDYFHSAHLGPDSGRYWAEVSAWDMHGSKKLTAVEIQALRKARRFQPSTKTATSDKSLRRYIKRMTPVAESYAARMEQKRLDKPRKRWAVDRQKKQPTTYVKNGKTYFHAYYVNGQRVVPIQNKYGRWVPWPEYQLRRKQDLLLRMFYVEGGKFRCIPHRKRDPFPSKLTFRKRGLIFAIS